MMDIADMAIQVGGKGGTMVNFILISRKIIIASLKFVGNSFV
jgi:hypothetical protein